MEKRISYSQFQSVKCVAKACDPLITKRNKLKERIDKLTAEYCDCDTQINSLEAGVISIIGLPVEQLIKKVIEPGIDVNGLPKKTTKYLPTDIVSYDEKHKQYVIAIKDNSEENIDIEENNIKENNVEEDASQHQSLVAGSSEVVSEVSQEAIVADSSIFE